MKKYFATCFMVCLFMTNVFSQQNFLSESPENLAVRLQAMPIVGGAPTTTTILSLSETLDAVFDSIAALTPIKGFNAAMRLPDGTYWKRARGAAEEVPAAIPLTTEHLMGAASISKIFVSVTLLRLMEEGLLSLDDSIGQYIGPYPNVAGSITVRQLLSHRSGLNDYFNENPATLNDWDSDLTHIWTSDEILNEYVLAPNFAPDDSWSYSNTNYLLAGVLIENLTGQPWYEVVREKVITPLGLSHTFAYPFETPGLQPFAHVFADLFGTGEMQDFQGLGYPLEGLFSLSTSAGCLITTPEDLTKFLERVFGGHVLLPATLAEMQTDYMGNSNNGRYGLGAASYPVLPGLENWGHDGNLIYKSVALYFPSENMSLAVLQNDARYHFFNDPTSPSHDLYNVFVGLLLAYQNYTQVSSVEDIALESGFSVYPNPASKSVHLAWDPKCAPVFPLHLVLTDMSGKVVATELLEHETDVFDVSHLPSGMYQVLMGAYTNSVMIVNR
jgi:D-alanyl-D-alanine carboxypeptidase